MAGTDTPWARLDQTFAFQGSDDDEEGDGGGNGYDGGGEGSRKGSVATIMIGHEPQQPHPSQHQQHQQHRNNNNTHHRTATTLTTSTTSTASTITPANADKAGHQRQISQVSTQQQQKQQQHQQHQQHRPRPSLDEQYATKPLPPVPQKARLQKSASTRSSSRPRDKPRHRSQPSTSSVASSVSSFNIPVGGATDAGGFGSSSLTRGGSVSSPTTLLRPAQSSAGWFSSVAQHRTQQKDASSAAAAGRLSIEPPALAPLDLPPLTSPPAHVLLATASNPNARPITPLAQPPLMAPLALPPLKPLSRGGRAPSFSSAHLPAAPRTAPHGDAVSLFSVRSVGSVATTTAASTHNNATRDDASSMYSERRAPTATAKHSPSLPSLSSFSSSSHLKPAAAAPGKAVRKFMRMAGKAASSAKDAIKGPLHAHNNGSTPSIGSHSASGPPSITVTTPVPSPMMSPMPSPRPPQSPSKGDTPTAPRASMVPRRRSMSKIRQLTGLDVGSVGGGSTAVSSTSLGALRRSQSADTPMRGRTPASSVSSASNVPVSTVLSPTSTTAAKPSIWNTSMFNSDDENDEDENEDEYEVDDRMSGRDSSIISRSPVLTTAVDEASNAADTPDPATASLLRSLSQTSSQPPPPVYQPMPRLQLGQQASPPKVADHQRTLLPPNRLLKIKRYSDPTMAPIIEHPDDATNPPGSNSSRASSHYSDHGGNSVPDTADKDASSFIPSRPAPIPVRSPSPPPVASPTQQSMLSLTLFPPVPSISAATIAKHIPTIRLFPSSSDNQASATSPTSPASAAGSPTTHSSSAASASRKISLPTSSDISNPWPTSPPPRPPPPPPLHPLNTAATDSEVSETTTDVAEKRLSGSGSTALFRSVQWGQMVDNSRSSSSTPTGNRLSLHARTKSSGSASESIATSIATSVANSSTSGSSALSSTVASTIGSSNRSAGFGSFSSASTASNRYSYQLASPPLPPPPPNYPLPPLPTSVLPMPISTPSQSAFDHDDDEGGARMMAARMMKKAASRDSVRWRPTALGKSLFRREASPGPGGDYVTTVTGGVAPTSQAAASQPTTGGGIRSSLSTRSSLSATTLLAAQRVAQTTRKAVEAVSESSGGSSSSAARLHELEMEKWREDLRSRIRMIPEGGEAESETPTAEDITTPAPTSTPAEQPPKTEVQATIHEIRSTPIHDNGLGGMI